MTRSSRHKSSKHPSEYSDSEKDLSSSKDRKDARVSKEASEKRKLDLKESDCVEEVVPSKRRKERAADAASDRWNGGEYDQREKKSTVKASGESKSRKKDGSVEMYVEETKKSGGGGGKSGEKDRKETGEGGVVEKEKRSIEGRGSEDHPRVSATKKGNDNSDLNGRVELESPERESQIERRMRKKRGESGDNDKHLDFEEDVNGGRLLTKDDVGGEGRQKDEKRKDERYREKFREDMDRENKPRDEKQRDEKQRDERSSKDHLISKSEDKHLKDEKDSSDMQKKRSKLQDGERKGEHDRDRNRDRDSCHVRERYHDREYGWDHGRDRDRDRDYDRDWDWDWDRERDGDRDREKNHNRERARDRDRDGERDRDRDYDRDYDGSHLDDRSTRYKDSSRGKRRSPEDPDDSSDTKPRGVKPRYSDFEKKSSSGDRVETDVNKGIPQSQQAYVDTISISDKRRTSPNINAGIDEHRDSVADQRSKALPPRDVSAVSERGYKYRSIEKSSKMDDNHFGEPLNENPSGSKASPKALMERSPSSSSIDRRSRNKTAARRSIDIEETGRRGSASDNRDFSVTEDRMNRESEKTFMDDLSPVDSSTHNRSNTSNFSSFSPHPNFRAGVENSSFTGSGEDDGRLNSNARYRRSSDPNMVRGPWRGVPNWPSQVPNGFMPFPHGGPHGGFQGMLPQFSAPPIFGVRPSMEMNHYGIPFQMADDRFSGHLRPLGSQNIMEGLGPSHMHQWDGSTGAFRDDSNSYGAEWDQSRHPMSVRGWDPNAEPWKAQNSEVKRDIPSPSPRNEQTLVDNGVAGQLGQTSHDEDNQDFGLNTERDDTRSIIASPMKESLISHEKPRDDSKSAINIVPSFSHYYISKLDISAELTHTETYTQCMSLLDTEGSVTVDEDTTVHTILKAATRGFRSAKTLLSSSLFPPLSDSVFQKALDLYKKERVEAKVIPYVAGGRLDMILAANLKNMEENVSEVDKVSQPALKCDAEMEKLMEPVSTPGQEMQNHINLGSSELEMAVEDSSRVELGEHQPIPNGEKMDSISSEQLKVLEVEKADGVSLLISEASHPNTPTTLPALGRNLEEDKCVHPDKDVQSVDAIRGPPVMPDGSPEACDALMSGSNESGSVILSQIHHSAESTH